MGATRQVTFGVAASLALTIAIGSAQAVPSSLVQTYNDPVPANGDHFGFSIARDGNRVLIGARFDDTSGPNVGQALLFDTVTGTFLQAFNDPTPTGDDRFGETVAISGDNVVVGARRDDTNGFNAGQAHLYSASTGALLRTFNDPTPSAAANFGNAVSVEGDNVLIGAFGGTGQVHLFSASTGALLRTFDDPTPSGSDFFGTSVLISGDNVLIGAAGDDTNAPEAGQAHLFSASTGALLQTFDDPTPTTDDEFGTSLAMCGDNVLICDPFDDTEGLNIGHAHLFSASTGALLRTFDDPTPTTQDLFGTSVSIDGALIVIGAHLDDTNGADQGQVHLFSATTGALLETIDDPTPTVFDHFGFAVLADQGQLLVGAFQDDTNAGGAGQAHLFDVPDGTAQIAEPGTLGLLLAGFIGLGLARRRGSARSRTL